MPLLFSYGTLQHEAVQLSTFGRVLLGHSDELVGFELGGFRVEDPEFIAKSGKADHATVRFNGRHDSRVRGMALEVTDAELGKPIDMNPPATNVSPPRWRPGNRHGFTLTRVTREVQSPERVP